MRSVATTSTSTTVSRDGSGRVDGFEEEIVTQLARDQDHHRRLSGAIDSLDRPLGNDLAARA
jgi:hypothetical protein